MSTPNKNIFSADEIVKFYNDQLQAHGNSAKGVGWKNDDAQNIRFSQLAKVFAGVQNFSINDLGCGTGQLYRFLQVNKLTPSFYIGYDILEEMIKAARESLGQGTDTDFIRINSSSEMKSADYSVSSGIFNVKYDAVESHWLQYVLSTIENMNSCSTKGFAFNLLTKYSDKEFMQSYLYYADPLFYFDYCKRNFSKNVALLHDYDQYDFTIIVRK